MRVTVVEVTNVGPDRGAFLQPSDHRSVDLAWSLHTSECRQTGMTQPVRCTASISSGHGREWALGTITRPPTYQPWFGRCPKVAWHDRQGICIGDPATRAVDRCDSLKRLSPSLLVGHRELDRLLVVGLRTVALLDERGNVLLQSRTPRKQQTLLGGFSADGALFVQLVQAGPYEPAALRGFDSITGAPSGSVDAGTIHEAIDRALRTSARAKSYTNDERRSLWGGFWLGRVGMTADPDTNTLLLDVRIPTGETCEMFGKTAALVSEHWIRLAVTA
jgi:hypothetical protein